MKTRPSRKPSSLTARLLSIPVHFYRAAISPLTPPSCRFTPTCSQYALDALRLYGPIHATAMTARRIARCHPWGGSGYDPVPVPLPAWFRDVDVHTHVNPQDGSAITSIDTTQQSLPAHPGPYSVGIHPWNAHLASDQAFHHLAQAAADPRVAAIGECGLDKLRGPEMALQMAVFRRQAELAESLRLPLIIHCVRAAEQLLALHKELRPTVPWIYHGFRGKPQQAQQLTAHGIYLSLGPNHNPAVPAAVPPHLLLHETDTQ